MKRSAFPPRQNRRAAERGIFNARNLHSVARMLYSERIWSSLGNVYYYFKTKEAISEAVIEDRLNQVREAHKSWDEGGSPKERLCAFVDSVLGDREVLARSGCALGTLSSELSKERGSLAKKKHPAF